MSVLGIDIGTTGCKAILIDRENAVIGHGYAGYGYKSYGDGRVEQNPEDWYQAMTEAAKQALKGHDAEYIQAISMSTQGGSSCLLDENDNIITPAITWMDSRAERQADELDELLGGDYIYLTTGWKSHAGLDMAKARWIQENEPAWMEKAKYFVSTLEYIQFRLTGVMSIDPTNAAMRQMMNLQTLTWDSRILSAVTLEQEKLPPITPVGTFLGPLLPQAALEMGLTTHTVVFQGAHDQYCGALGSTAFHPGDLMVSTGTAWVILATVDHVVSTSTYISPGPHVLPGVYGALASLSTGGAALDWIKSNAKDLTYLKIDEYAHCCHEGNRNLLFYPYLTGAGYPIWKSSFKASFLGLELYHTSEDLAVACMESIAFQLRLMIEDYEKNSIAVNCIKITGGAAKSSAWLKIIQSVIRRPVYVAEVKDAACIGAAAIAGVGVGMYADYDEAVSHFTRLTPVESASSDMNSYYEKKYKKFVQGLIALQSIDQWE